MIVSRTYYHELLVLILVGVGCAFAQASKPAPKGEITEIKATGCVRKAAKGPCLLLVTLDGRTTYSFVVAPKPDIGSIITIDGKPNSGPDPCKQGVAVNISDWQPTGDQCEQ